MSNDKEKGISTFHCEDHKDILTSSKMVWYEGVQPHRIVILKKKASSMGVDKEEYVTYQENLVLKDGVFHHRDFYWGHYFGENREKAVEDFQKRSKDL